MTLRLLGLTALVLSIFSGFAWSATAEASFYYDESYYNWPVPCYEYDRYGHCMSSGNRYRATRDDDYYHHLNGGRGYDNGYYGNSYYEGNYGYNDSRYRIVDNVYLSNFKSDCYWHYGTQRCDQRKMRSGMYRY